MVRYSIYFVISIILCANIAHGQQTVQHTLYMLDKYQYNAAYAGLDYSLSANVHYRSQWQGLDGSPGYIGVNAHLPFYVWSGALGTQLSSRNIGNSNYNTLAFSYNYVLSLEGGLWSNGFRLGIDQLQLDGGKVLTPDGIYVGGTVNHQDPLLLPGLDSGVGLLWEASTYYKSENIEGGLSIGFLPGSDIGAEAFTFNKTPHMTLYGQYVHTIFGEFDVLQSILLKSDFNQIQTEVASVVKINGNVFGGIGLRGYSSNSLDAIMVILGVKLSKNITLSYSYDAGISSLRDSNEGSHELLVNYNLQKLIGTGLPPKIIYNTRYL